MLEISSNQSESSDSQKPKRLEDFFEKNTQNTKYYQQNDYSIAKHQQEYGHKKFIKP